LFDSDERHLAPSWRFRDSGVICKSHSRKKATVYTHNSDLQSHIENSGLSAIAEHLVMKPITLITIAGPYDIDDSENVTGLKPAIEIL